MHKSDRRLYVDANDKVVEADNPSRVKLLVGKGGEIPMEEARRYGLVGDGPDAATTQERTSGTLEPGTPSEAASAGSARGRTTKKD